ncbi:unnamed protein product [Caenorhabditis sp. 36 PRJEB53466]|nr:unnamed protein product [Caenorhabditis sp. 36 PRJEB53466]
MTEIHRTLRSLMKRGKVGPGTDYVDASEDPAYIEESREIWGLKAHLNNILDEGDFYRFILKTWRSTDRTLLKEINRKNKELEKQQKDVETMENVAEVIEDWKKTCEERRKSVRMESDRKEFVRKSRRVLRKMDENGEKVDWTSLRSSAESMKNDLERIKANDAKTKKLNEEREEKVRAHYQMMEEVHKIKRVNADELRLRQIRWGPADYFFSNWQKFLVWLEKNTLNNEDEN